MKNVTVARAVATAVAALSLGITGGALSQQAAQQPSPDMSFFITSKGLGKGADLGGIAGADHRSRYDTAGAGGRIGKAHFLCRGAEQLAGEIAAEAADIAQRESERTVQGIGTAGNRAGGGNCVDGLVVSGALGPGHRNSRCDDRQ